jgi:hypothetical protein
MKPARVAALAQEHGLPLTAKGLCNIEGNWVDYVSWEVVHFLAGLYDAKAADLVIPEETADSSVGGAA